MFLKVSPAGSGQQNERLLSRHINPFNKTSFVGIFLDRQARTRCPPRFNNLGIGPRFWANPFEQVEDQSIHSIGHKQKPPLDHVDDLLGMARAEIAIPTPAKITTEDKSRRAVTGSDKNTTPPMAAITGTDS